MNCLTLTLIQTKKIDKFPIILVGSKFWSGLIEWLRILLKGTISKIDLKLISIVDTEYEIIQIIDKFYENYLLKPNSNLFKRPIFNLYESLKNSNANIKRNSNVNCFSLF